MQVYFIFNQNIYLEANSSSQIRRTTCIREGGLFSNIYTWWIFPTTSHAAKQKRADGFFFADYLLLPWKCVTYRTLHTYRSFSCPFGKHNRIRWWCCCSCHCSTELPTTCACNTELFLNQKVQNNKHISILWIILNVFNILKNERKRYEYILLTNFFTFCHKILVLAHTALTSRPFFVYLAPWA